MEKLKLTLAAPRQIVSGQIFGIGVDVTNVGRGPITVRSVTPHLIPGRLLALQDKWEVTELDQLEQRKRALAAEMEQQLALAYAQLERQESKEQRGAGRPRPVEQKVLLAGFRVVAGFLR